MLAECLISVGASMISASEITQKASLQSPLPMPDQIMLRVQLLHQMPPKPNIWGVRFFFGLKYVKTGLDGKGGGTALGLTEAFDSITIGAFLARPFLTLALFRAGTMLSLLVSAAIFRFPLRKACSGWGAYQGAAKHRRRPTLWPDRKRQPRYTRTGACLVDSGLPWALHWKAVFLQLWDWANRRIHTADSSTDELWWMDAVSPSCSGMWLMRDNHRFGNRQNQVDSHMGRWYGTFV